MVENKKIAGLSLFLAVLLAFIFWGEYKLPLYLAIPLGLTGLLLYPIYRYEMGKWDKVLAQNQKVLQSQQQELESLNQIIEKGEELIAVQKREIRLLEQESLSWDEQARLKLVQWYFRTKDKDKITIH